MSIGRPPRPALERFMKRIVWSDHVYRRSHCVIWQGSLTKGYGRFAYATVNGQPRSMPAHRWLYEQWVGPIPADLVCDHLCRNRACVNPAHIEIVSPRENVLRGVGPTARLAARSVCDCGREFDGMTGGRRVCVSCRRAKFRRDSDRRRRARLATANAHRSEYEETLRRFKGEIPAGTPAYDRARNAALSAVVKAHPRNYRAQLDALRSINTNVRSLSVSGT